MGQLGFFDADKRLEALSARGDPLEAIDHLVPLPAKLRQKDRDARTWGQSGVKIDHCSRCPPVNFPRWPRNALPHGRAPRRSKCTLSSSGQSSTCSSRSLTSPSVRQDISLSRGPHRMHTPRQSHSCSRRLMFRFAIATGRLMKET
jgi:hypothetical protein